jgi:hypothetical protein
MPPTALPAAAPLPFLLTTEVARLLGISYACLMSALRSDRFERPRKDSSGDYVWFPEDVARARKALASPRRAPRGLSHAR